MRTYILKRLLLLPITTFFISFVTFLIIQLAPGDPAQMKVSPGVGGQQQGDQSVSREIYEKTREQFDLDKPLLMRFVRWFGRLCAIDVQVTSYKKLYQAEVKQLIERRYSEENPEKIAAQREQFESRITSETVSEGRAVEDEVERQLSDWVASQAEKQRFKYSSEINAVRANYIETHGENYDEQFEYAGLAINRTEAGYPYFLDFGQSITDDREVWTWLAEKLPRSLLLSVISIFLAYVIAIPLGIHSAVFKGSFSDAVITTVLFILYSLPNFWVAIMLLLFVSKGGTWLPLFPVKGLGSEEPANYLLDLTWHLVLPVTCLTYASFAYISRQMRAGMLEVIRKDYIRTARAKGLDETVVVFKHALRNGLIPIITIVAVILPALIGGSVIIETIFEIDGIGRLGFRSILNRDYPILMAIFTLSAFLTLVGIFLSDLLYVVVNPQISFGGR